MPALTRRELALLAGLGLIASGCSSEPRNLGGESTDDGRLIDDLANEIRGARDHAAIAKDTALVGVHTAHLAALGAPTTETLASISASPESGSAAYSSSLSITFDEDLITHEARLQKSLAEGAVAAHSGSLARALASMSAAIAQQVVRLHG